MEFIQFYPWRLIRPFKSTRVPIQPSTFVAGGRLYNSRGERFMEKYDPVKKEAATRDVSARGIFDQIRHGLAVDGGVTLDVSQIPDAQFRIDNTKVTDILDPKGIDYRTIPLVVAPEAHFFMGGVLIDEHGRSDLSGLYAAGENAGGIHGGNRLNSNAVPDTQVFGYRAGIDAASRAGTAGNGRGDMSVVERWAGRLQRARSAKSELQPGFEELIRHQQNEMSLGLGIVRTGDGLRRAESEIAGIRERLAGLEVTSLGEVLAAMEIEDLCAVGAACARSALMREESRAAHYREDFPNVDPGWVRTITVDKTGLAAQAIQRGPEEERWQGGQGIVANPKASQPGAKEFVE
jgi:fumarate reductase (CoM/CoB) subunit A